MGAIIPAPGTGQKESWIFGATLTTNKKPGKPGFLVLAPRIGGEKRGVA
jgi:hypothetical protein